MDKNDIINLNLGQLLVMADRMNVLPAEKGVSLPHGCAYGIALNVGNFFFGAHSHDTGISVHVYIRHPETQEDYEIINGTYWYSSRYDFNKFTWEKGKWDKSLQEAINIIREKTTEAEVEYQCKQNSLKDKALSKEKQKKTKFESIF
jgi:hypothetical protein